MATRRSGAQVQRAAEIPKGAEAVDAEEQPVSDEEAEDSKSTRLTLMEEILLLGIKDREVRQTTDTSISFLSFSVTMPSCLRAIHHSGTTAFRLACGVV
jgi:hypothetical protein